MWKEFVVVRAERRFFLSRERNRDERSWICFDVYQDKRITGIVYDRDKGMGKCMMDTELENIK